MEAGNAAGGIAGEEGSLALFTARTTCPPSIIMKKGAGLLPRIRAVRRTGLSTEVVPETYHPGVESSSGIAAPTMNLRFPLTSRSVQMEI